MTRYVFGGGGDTALVNQSGQIMANTSANVYSARTGGVQVTDILTMAGAPLAGTVTSDAYGQIIFQGPDAYVATLWLDFGGGQPRWAVRPTNIDITASKKIQDDVLLNANPVFTGAPTISNYTNALHNHDNVANAGDIKEVRITNDAISDVPLNVDAMTGTTAALQTWSVNSVQKASLTKDGYLAANGLAAGNSGVNTNTADLYRGTDSGFTSRIASYKTAAGTELSYIDANGSFIQPGTWATYTPAWTASGSAPNIGNGTLTGRWTQVGKTVFAKIHLIAGSTTTWGSGDFRFGLPVNAGGSFDPRGGGTAWLFDNGNAFYVAVAYVEATWTRLFTHNTAFAVNATTPFTWGNTDVIEAFVTYEAA